MKRVNPDTSHIWKDALENNASFPLELDRLKNILNVTLCKSPMRTRGEKKTLSYYREHLRSWYLIQAEPLDTLLDFQYFVAFFFFFSFFNFFFFHFKWIRIISAMKQLRSIRCHAVNKAINVEFGWFTGRKEKTTKTSGVERILLYLAFKFFFLPHVHHRCLVSVSIAKIMRKNYLSPFQNPSIRLSRLDYRC